MSIGCVRGRGIGCRVRGLALPARGSRPAAILAVLTLGLALLATSVAGLARAEPVRAGAVEVELVSQQGFARPGESVLLGVRLRHDPKWHTYWRNPGDSGLATRVEPAGPAGVRFGDIVWPAPERFFVGPLANYGYEGEIVLPFRMDVPDKGLTGDALQLGARVEWLVCREVCIPGEAELVLRLPLRSGPAVSDRAAGKTVETGAASRHAPLFDAMARRSPSPGPPLAARLHAGPTPVGASGASVALVLEASPELGALTSAEFFPYPPGVISAPAPQPLLRTAAGWRLDLVLAEGMPVPTALDGLLVADGKPYELRAREVPGPPPAGEQIAVAQAPPAPPGATRGLGFLMGFGSSATPAGSLAGSMTPGVAGVPSETAAATVTGAGSLSQGALMLAFGLLGGLLLNLMPCVFPVIGMKVLGFARQAPGALAFSAGVIVSFWMLALGMVALRAAGEAIGWGFQLQSPLFVAVMALFFVLIGLNFSGVFEVGLGLTRLGGIGPGAGSGVTGSFATGALAVLVATPCTAPFMGSALGYTLGRPALETFAVFTAIGVGMALPYVALALFPGWMRWLPRPGPWMETLKQGFAFPMYATAVWLAWVLAQQSGADAVFRLGAAAVLLAFAAWLYGRFLMAQGLRADGVRAAPASRLLAVVLVAASVFGLVSLVAPIRGGAAVPAAGSVAPGVIPDGTADPNLGASPGASSEAPGPDVRRPAPAWASWSEAAVEAALARGQTVFVDFTAAWCVTCQANKRLVLDREPVASAFERAGVLALRADWTNRDPAITRALARLGRIGVPVYVVYRPGAAPQILPEILTAQTVLQALPSPVVRVPAGTGFRGIDDWGRPVRVTRAKPRIVSLAPHATELLLAAGAGPLLVGLDSHSLALGASGEALQLPRLAVWPAVDAEKLLALAPDLIVVWAAGLDVRHLERLERIAPTYVSDPRRLSDIAETLERFAGLASDAAGAEAAGAKALQLRESIAQLRARYSGQAGIPVFYQLWSKPLITVSDRGILGEAMRLCGARNVFADLPQQAPVVDPEAVLAAAPALLVVSDAADEVAGHWRRLGLWQGRSERIAVIEADALQQPGPRMLEAVSALCEAVEAARMQTVASSRS